jgi:hypothetical protein
MHTDAHNIVPPIIIHIGIYFANATLIKYKSYYIKLILCINKGIIGGNQWRHL